MGEECARHGVKAIQLTGWNFGGQDQGNPSHDPDPRLGTFEELKEAIAQIQAMGVKLILFSKFTWADRATEWFRNELVKYAIKDPHGDYQVHPGYQYQTLTQLLDINTKRLVPMCFLSEEYLRICEAEFRKTLDLGADGILFDECLHHTPALLCFDESHGHRPGAPVYANDRLLIQRFAAIARERNPDFLFAAEAAYDWEFEAYHVSYHRSESKHHIPLSRYMLPDVPLITAVTGFDDRNMVNQCLLYRYAISYEPYNVKGRLDDYPMTMAYGKQMDALRTELRDYFWDGEFRHEVGAAVTCDGKPHHPYAVFINRITGKPGVVIANFDEHQTITVQAVLDDGVRLNRYRLVDDGAWHSAEQGIELPPCSGAVPDRLRQAAENGTTPMADTTHTPLLAPLELAKTPMTGPIHATGQPGNCVPTPRRPNVAQVFASPTARPRSTMLTLAMPERITASAIRNAGHGDLDSPAAHKREPPAARSPTSSTRTCPAWYAICA